jgi:hypothetical protein
MKINVFSGARRLAFLIAFVGIITAIILVFNSEPSIYYNYRIAYFGADRVLSDECRIGIDGAKYLDFNNKDGTSFHVRLCFAASRANDGRMLVPYAERDGQTWMNSAYSDEVQRHMDMYASFIFKLKPSDFEKAQSDYSSEKFWLRAKGIGYIALGAILFWFFVSCAGWVVRGFLEIPRGHDYRINPINK